MLGHIRSRRLTAGVTLISACLAMLLWGVGQKSASAPLRQGSSLEDRVKALETSRTEFEKSLNDKIASAQKTTQDKIDAMQKQLNQAQTDTQANLAKEQSDRKGQIDALAATSPPVGTIVPTGGSNTPSGWLYCNGAAVSRSAYPELFAAIGTLWGVGDGSTTFNLPDLQARFLRGCVGSSGRDPDWATRKPSGTGVASGPGSTQEDATHAPRNNAFDVGGGTHKLRIPWSDQPGAGPSSTATGPGNPGLIKDYGMWSNPGGEHTHTITGGDSETRPKNAYVFWFIKAGR